MTVTRKILFPTIALFVLVLVLLIGLIIAYANNSLETQEASSLELLRQSFDNATEAQKQLALSLATQLAENPDVQAAFAAKDRQRLIDLTLPAYKILAEKYGVSQAQFHVPPATSFLRLHQLDRFDDDLSSFRFTVLAANEQRQPIAGLEIGRGGIGVRGVVPVSYQGQHIGTVEYGLDPGLAALEELKREYGVDWQITLSRGPAEIATFRALTDTAQVPLDALLLQSSTLAQPVFANADAYRQVLAGQSQTYRTLIDGRDLAIFSTPLRDYANQVIGVVDIIRDRTQTVQLLTARMLAAIASLVVVMGVGILVSATVVTRLMRPISQLTEVAQAVEQGDLNRQATVVSHDEIATLGGAFNSMTQRIRSLIDSLETRVEMRTAQLQASAEVGRAATSILDPDQLLRESVQLITARFGFYYAAVFLTDDLGQWALLREASGPGDVAWVLKQSGHKLQIGGKSMVSAAITQRQPRIALDVGTEAVRFANPLLPDTRSEIALPLIVGDRVLGALNVQSVQMAAFDEASATVLQTMADQIAIALTNATRYRRERARAEQTTGLLEAALELSSQPDEIRLYERIEEVSSSLLGADGVGLWFAIDQERLELRHTINVGPADLTGRQLRTGEGLVGKVYASGLILRVDDYLTWTGRANVFADAPFHSAMGVPLMWQNQVLGVLAITRSKPGQPFTVEDESLAQLLAAQAAAALDNLRLRAEQARAVEDLNILNRRLTGEAWQALDQSLTYEHRQTPTVMPRPGLSLQVPIELRGVPIGTITLEDAHARTFTDDEQALINGVTRQLALALENQRLTDIAQSAAQRNRAIAETADKIHQLTNLDTILQVAVTELSRITGVSGVGVQFGFAPAKTNGHPADRAQENER
ncbi:MAG: GAF domain-containing protein [Thermoflexales bacterium]|nr:GAF domain-containing protein [Thermoflexales bacterium]